MKTWLHFVGRQYYKTPEAFVNEANKYGMTRRITRQALKK